MKGFWTMLKMNLKMLVRNKGYLVCIVLVPLVAVLMLTTNGFASDGTVDETGSIKEWSEDEMALSLSNETLMVKVYDANQTESSEYLLNQLLRAGFYEVYREKNTEITEEEIEAVAKDIFERSSVRAILYIPEDFDSVAVKDGKLNLKIYQGYEDARVTILTGDLVSICQVIAGYQNQYSDNKEEFNNVLQQQEIEQMEQQIVKLQKETALNLNVEQKEQSSQIGYSLAFLTVSFIFSGVFIASIIIHEYENKTMNRLELSMSTRVCYFLVKICCIIVTSVIQTIVLGIGITLIVKSDFGISMGEYLFFVFLQGLIFNLLSVVIGLIVNNVLVTTAVSFMSYTLSSLLGGLYFPLSEGGIWGRLARLFPQHWMIQASEMLMAGKSGVNTMYVIVILAFLLVLGTVGLLAAKVRSTSVTA